MRRKAKNKTKGRGNKKEAKQIKDSKKDIDKQMVDPRLLHFLSYPELNVYDDPDNSFHA